MLYLQMAVSNETILNVSALSGIHNTVKQSLPDDASMWNFKYMMIAPSAEEAKKMTLTNLPLDGIVCCVGYVIHGIGNR